MCNRLSQDLNNIAAIAVDQRQASTTLAQNGSSHASTSGSHASVVSSRDSSINVMKRSPSPEDGLSDSLEPNNAKKPRTGRRSAFKRVLTHTFNLQPYRERNQKNKGFKLPSSLPDTIQADLTAFPAIKHGKWKLACLSDTDLAHVRGVVHAINPEDILSCVALLYENTDLVRLERGRMLRVSGKAEDIEGHLSKKQVALDVHYSLEIEIHLDVANIRNIDTDGMKKSMARQIPVAIEGLLWRAFFMNRSQQAFIRPVEESSKIKFSKTNLEWFYACLPRPPVAASYQPRDIKGKGKAREEDLDADEITGSRPIEAPGLVPRL